MQPMPSLIGGVTVRVGSTIYDGSVRGQLQRIRQQLIEKLAFCAGIARPQSGRDRKRLHV